MLLLACVGEGAKLLAGLVDAMVLRCGVHSCAAECTRMRCCA